MSFDKIIITCFILAGLYFLATDYIKNQTQIVNNGSSIVSNTQIAGITVTKETPVMNLTSEQENALGNLLIQAKTSNKPILLYFYADWCSNCKRFAPVINQVAKEYADKSLYLPINADIPETKYLLNIFGVPGYPTVYIIDPVTKKYVDGGQDKADLENYLNIFLGKK